MKRTVLFILLVGLLSISLFSSCKSDGSSSSGSDVEVNLDMDALENLDENSEENVKVEVEMDKPIEAQQLAKKMLTEKADKEIVEKAKVEDRNETKLVGKSQEQLEQEKKLKLESTKELIEKSENKGKTCEQILEEQDGIVEEFIKSKDRKLIVKMVKLQNDPFFVECNKVETFKLEMDKIRDKLDAAMEQE